MKPRSQWFAAFTGRWQHFGRRDQLMLIVLAMFLLSVGLISGVWQPTKQRLERAERSYQQRLSLVSEMRRAKPTRRSGVSQPWASRISDSATAAGLELLELNKDSASLRVVVSGDADALLSWLIQGEREGVHMQSLTLDRQENQLHARVAWGVN
jgi:general secretion pathway protein M